MPDDIPTAPELEDWAPLEPPRSCDPTPKPGAVALLRWLRERWGGLDLGISRACVSASSHHEEGRAIDWSPPAAPSSIIGDAAIAELLAPDFWGRDAAMARSLGIRYLIWQRRIWVAGKGWSSYTGASQHRDHVHISLSWAGARIETSGYDPYGGLVEGCPVQVDVAPVRGLEAQSERFRRALVYLALSLELDPSALAAVMSWETAGSFSPSVRAGGNPSGAVGLIQFTGAAASAVGTTKEALSQMTQLEQLEYVRRYFEAVGHEPRSSWDALDHYLAVFAPSAIGKAPDFAIYTKGDGRYEGNAAMDFDGDGVITRADVGAKWLPFLAEAEAKEPLQVSTIGAFGIVAPMLTLGTAAAALVAKDKL